MSYMFLDKNYTGIYSQSEITNNEECTNTRWPGVLYSGSHFIR